MNQIVLDRIRQLIIEWQLESGNLSYQNKKDHWFENPAKSGKYLIKFSIELKTCLCDGILNTLVYIKIIKQLIEHQKWRTTYSPFYYLNNASVYFLFTTLSLIEALSVKFLEIFLIISL